MNTKGGQYYREYVTMRNKAIWECRKAARHFERTIAKKAKKTPKTCFVYARSKMKTKKGIGDLDGGEQGKADTSNDKSEVLNFVYSSMYKREDVESMPTIQP